MSENLDVKFYGDLILPESPATLTDAILLSQEIPALCEESKSAVTFSIVPLTEYCGEQEKILNEITAKNVEKVSEIMDEFEEMNLYLEELIESQVANDYTPVASLLNSIETQHNAFKHNITKNIQEVLLLVVPLLVVVLQLGPSWGRRKKRRRRRTRTRTRSWRMRRMRRWSRRRRIGLAEA